MKEYEITKVWKHVNIYLCKINNNEYEICACINCKEIHGVQSHQSLIELDELRLCCKKPDNYRTHVGATKIIKNWIKDNNIKVEKE